MNSVKVKRVFVAKEFQWKRLKFALVRKTEWMSFQIPSSWNELSAEQLLKISNLLFRGQLLNTFKRKALAILLNLEGEKQLKRMINKGFIDAAAMYDLENLTHFLTETPTLTTNKLPEVFGFYGPDDCLLNITADEYIYCYKYSREYAEAENVEALNKLIAVLYRKPKFLLTIRQQLNSYDGDARCEFNHTFIEKNAKIIAKWPMEYKIAILTFYTSSERYMAACFPTVFTTPEKGTKKKEAEWGEIIVSMAGTKFGTLEQTGKALIWNLLTAIEQNLQKHD